MFKHVGEIALLAFVLLLVLFTCITPRLEERDKRKHRGERGGCM